MLFNSIPFLIFFPVVCFVFFSLPARYRAFFLLAAGAVFYGSWHVWYLALLGGSTIFNYFAGRLVEDVSSDRARRRVVALTVATNLGLLAVFKYADFALGTVDSLASLLGFPLDLPILRILLPVGISFYTFEGICYVVDVYRGKMPAVRSMVEFAQFMTFFPHLVAGPILRASELVPQFRRTTRVDTNRIASGLVLMVWGFVQKVLMADTISPVVDMVYRNPDAFSATALVLASYGFAFQIYCDFSGYTDIARGSSRILGYELVHNFRRPYFAVNVTEFWHRWHISLSTWLRDYLFIPLGGSRGSRWFYFRNLFITMLLGGLWHGASWTFAIWGAVHGGALILHKIFLQWRGERSPSTIGRVVAGLVTFHVVTLAWVFFRAPTLDAATGVLERIASGARGHEIDFLLPACAIAALLAVHVVESRWNVPRLVFAYPRLTRYVAAIAMVFVLARIVMTPVTSFIYFQF